MALRLENVSCCYGSGGPLPVTAVEDISLEISDGELVGLVGHTGSGKSTLAQLICGLVRATSGEIWLGDLRLTDKKPAKAAELARRVGMVFQYPEHQLFAETVAKELAYGPDNLGWPREQTEAASRELLRRLGLPEAALEANPYQLSGGERRKVALASVLIMQPPLLLLDEPFVGLDAVARQDFLRLLLAWQREQHSTIICISHDIDILASFCQRLLVLQAGRLRLDMPARQAFGQQELLRECGICLPLAREATLACQAEGWPVTAEALSLEEAAAAILAGIRAAAGGRKAGGADGN